MSAGRLEDRRAIVSGAAGGQGEAVCRRFLAEGAHVIATDVEEQALDALTDRLANGGADIVGVVADLRDESAIAAVVERAVASFGGLDILYNNASVRLADRDAPTDELEPEVWDLTFEVNARGTFLFCKHALPHLLEAKGLIINVSSVAGYRGDTECHAYSATKGAQLALTASLAQTYGPRGVRVVALCPGFIATPMVRRYLEEPELREAVTNATALRRVGEPDEIASAAAFLASDDAAFMTDVIVPVHGGLVK